MWITADVTFDTDEAAREAERLVREKKLAGISADLGNVTSTLEVLELDSAGLPVDWLETVEKGEVVGGTLTPMPAFGDARIVSNPDGTLTAWLVAEGAMSSDRRTIQLGALVWRDPAPLMFQDTTSEGHSGAVFVGNLSNFARVDTALVGAFDPYPELFEDPQLPAVTRPHVEEGRYVGHGAQWGVCHLAYGGCVTAPESKTGYSLARWKEVGDIVGVPVYKNPHDDTGHAPAHLTLQEARDWYDTHCQLEGLAEVGEDTFGIWLSGAASPEIDGMFLSGDWRIADTADGPNLELISWLATTRPALPLALVAADQQMSLVAAGVVVESAPVDPIKESLVMLANEVLALRSYVDDLRIEREAERLIASLSV